MPSFKHLGQWLKDVGKLTPSDSHPLHHITESWVLVTLKMTTWRHLDFSLLLKENTPLKIIEQKIIEHHGGAVYDLELWKDQVCTKNKLDDFSQTLRTVFELDEYDDMNNNRNGNDDDDDDEPDSEDDDDDDDDNDDLEDDDNDDNNNKKNDKSKRKRRARPNDDDVLGSSENVDFQNSDQEPNNEENEDQDEDQNRGRLAPKGSNHNFEVVLYYDFKPFQSSCSLLLCSPRTLVPEMEETTQDK